MLGQVAAEREAAAGTDSPDFGTSPFAAALFLDGPATIKAAIIALGSRLEPLPAVIPLAGPVEIHRM
jgi:hypothetical protein